MIDVTYLKKIIKINQIWFPSELTVTDLLKQKRKADILFVHGMDRKNIDVKSCGVQEFHTCMNNLTKSEEEMLTGINKNVKYEIRRSEKDGIEIRIYTGKELADDDTLLQRFADIYERMYRSKGMNEKLNLATIRRYMELDSILFSVVLYEGEIIIFHSYLMDKEDVRLLHSASCFREGSTDTNMIGRANKRLHWEDMKYFKENGVIRYDWGGISDLDNPNGIDAFKLKFGGEKTTYYNVFAGNTVLGKLAVCFMKMLGKVE